MVGKGPRENSHATWAHVGELLAKEEANTAPSTIGTGACTAKERSQMRCGPTWAISLPKLAAYPQTICPTNRP